MKTLLDSRQLHAFVMLSHTGSFTQAANNLFLTPSAVSHALKELEQRVGCLLLPWVATREMADQSLVTFPLGPRRLKRNWGIVYWQDSRLTWAEETFVKICCSVTKKFAT